MHLLVPIKQLHLAKTRLRSEAHGGSASQTGTRRDGHVPPEHIALVTAFAMDTVFAARVARLVAEVVVVTSDPALSEKFRRAGIRIIDDHPPKGLNAALTRADRVVRRRDSRARTGALQADLPTLRPEELDAAIEAAGAARAYCPDHDGTGTTLLLSASSLSSPEDPLCPRFGAGSAAAHAETGARTLHGPWPTLRCDVDTAEDLRRAGRLGLGPHSAEHTARLHRCSQ